MPAFSIGGNALEEQGIKAKMSVVRVGVQQLLLELSVSCRILACVDAGRVQLSRSF